ncbi:MAG: hypothetical protein ACTSQZ_07915 [Candidatus Thorarchaeota archaeon]
MNGHHRLHLILMIIVSALIVGVGLIQSSSSTIQLIPSNSNQHTMAQDTLRPDIYEWGIDGIVGGENSFTVWANISDNDSGVLNVSMLIKMDYNAPTETLMLSNGTFFVVEVFPLILNHTYRIWIESYDIALNRAQGYARNFDLTIDPNPPIDPNLSFPFVVPSSLALFATVVLIGYVINRRKPLPETIASESNLIDE